MADTKITYKINNKADSANDTKWSDVDLSAIKEKAQNAKNAKTVCKELCLVLGENYLTNKSDLGYPHHVFSDDILVVSKTGVIAAYDRLMQNDPENTSALKHINKHRKALGLDKKSETNTIHKFNTYIEICEMPEGDLAGRTQITMSALEIYPDNSQYNSNGISWLQEYVEANMDSAIGCPFVVSWLDEENGIPSDHGTMTTDDEGNISFDGDTVGTNLEPYIGQVEIDGELKDALIFKGYLYNQRYPAFVQWLKDSIANGEQIKGSIEINGKGGNANIEYLDGATNDDGTPKMGRIPTVFDFSGLAILYIVEPADKTSQVIEVNEVNKDLSKNKDKDDKDNIIVNSKKFEINELSYDDIATIVSRAFNSSMTIMEPDEYHYYYIYKFYPQSQTVIMTDWDTPSEYYKTTYNITNDSVTIGDIIEVEQTWTPINEEPSVEINTSLIKDILYKNIKHEENTIDKGGDNKMDENEKKIAELNAKITELNTQLDEINSTVVEANKTIETKSSELNTVNEELTTLRKFKEDKDLENKKSEINDYFSNEISKNGFTEVELNMLKTEYVDKTDLDGLIAKEKELCVKKIKEINSVNKTIETNTNNDTLFMSIQNTEKSDEDYSDLF